MRPNKSKGVLEPAALKLFVEKGVAETSIRDIAAAADLAEGTLYRHYPSKEAFAKHLYQNAASTVIKELQAIHADSQDMESCLSGIVVFLCNLFDEEKEIFSYVFLTPVTTLHTLGIKNEHPIRAVAEILKTWFEKRSLTDRVPELVAAEILGAISGVANQIQLGVLKDSMGNYADDVMMAVFRLLKA
jgi:AcrR family transcriptional regulator